MQFHTIIVRPAVTDPRKGWLTAGPFRFRCALGRGGAHMAKREGDGRTPKGRFPLRRLWYRADRVTYPGGGLPKRRTRPSDGWCDAPEHRRYNRRIDLPFAASHERMWREDRLYDLVIEIGWNDRPAKPRRGSAIFLHVAREGYTPTEGCVALRRDHLLRLAPRLSGACSIVIL
jgi:L,D-peptidoglycan transpeptidase YkuD (ErfK/YbiS/YcfS/YnhG family)